MKLDELIRSMNLQRIMSSWKKLLVKETPLHELLEEPAALHSLSILTCCFSQTMADDCQGQIQDCSQVQEENCFRFLFNGGAATKKSGPFFFF